MTTLGNVLLLLFVCMGHDVQAAQRYRPGKASETHSCHKVRGVPKTLYRPVFMRPNGVNATFYKKYTEAYGIPILGSNKVTDDALKRACYTVRFLLADHSGIRHSLYKLGVRFAIMSATEVTLDIPERSHLDPWWNSRARGLGPSFDVPIVIGAEENVLCYPSNVDRYYQEDIFLHETAHAIDNLGAQVIIKGFDAARRELYANAKSMGLWHNTYAISDSREYFAEGVQSYFDVNTEGPPESNGIHNNINTREELRTYDPILYNLIRQLFPCNNTYLKRCESTRRLERQQVLKMNCNTEHLGFPKPAETRDCKDRFRLDCIHWWSDGECERNPGFMRYACTARCGFCAQAKPTCFDKRIECQYWSKDGECEKNAGYMNLACRLSCNRCQATQ